MLLQFKHIRLIAFLSTTALLGYILWSLIDATSIAQADKRFHLQMIYAIVMIITNGIFIRAIWHDHFLERTTKWRTTWMVLILGNFGVWIYILERKNLLKQNIAAKQPNVESIKD